MRLVVGCDDAGEPLLSVLEAYLSETHPDIEVVNLSAPESDHAEFYPDVAERVSLKVANHDADRGILICGTGLGMAMTACKVPGIRAATCHDTYSAERAVKSNNAQVLTMGARVIGAELAKSVLEAWLQSEWEDGTRSEPKVQRMVEIDKKYQSRR